MGELQPVIKWLRKGVHADEVAGLRARLAEETQARQRAEMAQEEMRSAKRARLAQSDREAAAVAWRDAAGSTGAMEVVDSGGFMARFLAFRQALARPARPKQHCPGERACGCPLLPHLYPPRVCLRAACRDLVDFLADQDDQG